MLKLDFMMTLILITFLFSFYFTSLVFYLGIRSIIIGPVFTYTGPVISNANPVTVYTYPVLTVLISTG